MPGKRWTQEEIAQVIAMRNAGDTYKQIGDRFGCSRQAICDLIFRQPSVEQHRKKQAVIRAERKALLTQMVEEGKTRPQIAQLMGLNPKHISALLRAHNLKPIFATSTWTANRVQQVEDLKARGFTNAHICRVLKISKGTLAGHLFRIKRRENPADWDEIARRNAEMRHERDGDIKRLAESGMSRGKIAEELGLTLKIVSYVCQRLGFKIVRPPPTRKRTSYALRTNGHSPINGRKTRVPTSYETNPIDLATPAAQRKSLAELNAFTCKFPVGDPGTPDFFFCGAIAAHKSPYCTHHHLRCYAPAEELAYA